MAKVAEVFSFFCLFEVYGGKAIVHAVWSNLHFYEFNSSEIFSQPS
jgi:hypothetical protein